VSRASTVPVSVSISWYFTLDEPELITKTDMTP
jgi:hypothetical protein